MPVSNRGVVLLPSRAGAPLPTHIGDEDVSTGMPETSDNPPPAPMGGARAEGRMGSKGGGRVGRPRGYAWRYRTITQRLLPRPSQDAAGPIRIAALAAMKGSGFIGKRTGRLSTSASLAHCWLGCAVHQQHAPACPMCLRRRLKLKDKKGAMLDSRGRRLDRFARPTCRSLTCGRS